MIARRIPFVLMWKPMTHSSNIELVHKVIFTTLGCNALVRNCVVVAIESRSIIVIRCQFYNISSFLARAQFWLVFFPPKSVIFAIIYCNLSYQTTILSWNVFSNFFFTKDFYASNKIYDVHLQMPDKKGSFTVVLLINWSLGASNN